MAEVKISIGGREFEVACRDGEEHFLQSAAGMLDNEAAALKDALGRMPETRMLLMAGLMLADKTASLEDQLKEQASAPSGGGAKRAKKAEAKLGKAQAELADVKAKLAEVQAEAKDATEARDAAIDAMEGMVSRLETASQNAKKAG